MMKIIVYCTDDTVGAFCRQHDDDECYRVELQCDG